MSESSITIKGVPASVTREQVMAAIETLGIDPKECVGLRFSSVGIEVEVCSDGRAGDLTSPRWRWTHDGKDVATHRLTIPIIEKSETP